MKACCDVKQTFTELPAKLMAAIVLYLSDLHQVEEMSVRSMLSSIHTNKRSSLVKETTKDPGTIFSFIFFFQLSIFVAYFILFLRFILPSRVLQL